MPIIYINIRLTATPEVDKPFTIDMIQGEPRQIPMPVHFMGYKATLTRRDYEPEKPSGPRIPKSPKKKKNVRQRSAKGRETLMQFTDNPIEILKGSQTGITVRDQQPRFKSLGLGSRYTPQPEVFDPVLTKYMHNKTYNIPQFIKESPYDRNQIQMQKRSTGSNNYLDTSIVGSQITQQKSPVNNEDYSRAQTSPKFKQRRYIPNRSTLVGWGEAQRETILGSNMHENVSISSYVAPTINPGKNDKYLVRPVSQMSPDKQVYKMDQKLNPMNAPNTQWQSIDLYEPTPKFNQLNMQSIDSSVNQEAFQNSPIRIKKTYGVLQKVTKTHRVQAALKKNMRTRVNNWQRDHNDKMDRSITPEIQKAIHQDAIIDLKKSLEALQKESLN